MATQDPNVSYGPTGVAEPGAPIQPGTPAPAPTAVTQIPAGATLISGPSGLQGLTESQIYRDPNSANIYKLAVQPKSDNLSTDSIGAGVATTPEPKVDSTVVLGQNIANSSLTSIQQSIADYLTQQQKLTEQQVAAAQTQTDQALAGLDDAYNTSNLDTLKNLEQQAEIEQKRKDLTNIMTQINSYKGALEQGLINIEGQPIAMDFIVGQQALLQRQASAKINTLVAQAALVQDNLNFAVDTVNRYYQAASQDRQDQIDRYKTLFQIQNDKLIRLSDKEERFINAQIQLLQDADKQQQTDKQNVLDLMMKYPDVFKKANISLDQPYENIVKAITPYLQNQDEKALVTNLATKYADAGIALTDTLAQAQAKLSKSKIYQDQIRGPVGSGGGAASASDFKDAKIESSVREDVVSLLDQVNSGDMTLDQAYKKLRTLYSPTEVTDKGLKDLLGFNTTESTTNNITETPITESSFTPNPNLTGFENASIPAVKAVGEAVGNVSKGFTNVIDGITNFFTGM